MINSEMNVVVFVCNWDGLSCIEAAAQAGLSYPASLRVVRTSCLSRVHQGLILKAFELGADGVIMLGCKPDACHFDNDCTLTNQGYDKIRAVLQLLGLGEERLIMMQLPRGDGHGFVEQVADFIKGIEHIRPTATVQV